jgi:hypothetical protein
MITLSVADSGEVVGTVPDADFQMLVDQLEEESEEDTDYYITPSTIAMLEEHGASETLLAVLRRAVGGSEGADVRWART